MVIRGALGTLFFFRSGSKMFYFKRSLDRQLAVTNRKPYFVLYTNYERSFVRSELLALDGASDGLATRAQDIDDCGSQKNGLKHD